jgi:hypothetical protein
MRENGKVANHLVKYTHHADGRAHFSQHGKVRTEIKRMAVALENQQGHLFTVLAQNLESFSIAKRSGRNRLTLEIERDVMAVKIVGWRYPFATLKRPEGAPSTGKLIGIQLGEGLRFGFFVSPPKGYRFDDWTLFLSVDTIPLLSPDKAPHLIFIGGFDHGQTAFNHSKDTEFLALAYPCAEPNALAETIGTVDLIQSNALKQ